MSALLRILVLCPFAPRTDAAHGGRVTASLLLRLAERHELALVCIRGEGEPATDAGLCDRCELVEEVVVRRPSPGGWAMRARQLAKPLWGYPNMVERAAAPGYEQRVRAVAAAFRPDVVQIDLAETARHLGGLDDCRAPRILVEHEPGASAARDWSGAAAGPRRLWRRLDALAWRRFARRAYRAVDAVVVFTEADAEAVRALAPGARVRAIPFAVEVPERPLDPLGDGQTVLFFGGYEHPPNLDAALRLERTIFPAVRARVPGARLQLVGASPTEEMRRLAGPAVHLTGRVDSLEPYLDRAAVVVAPLRLGGGMRVKVLEALAAGKALVASRRALAGLSLDPAAAVVAEADGDVADAVVGLLSDPDRRRAVATAGRRWVESSLGWERIVASWGELYGELAAGRE